MVGYFIFLKFINSIICTIHTLYILPHLTKSVHLACSEANLNKAILISMKNALRSA